ncbi:MAG: hypothetical protein M1839_001819 [Geoglossum umbratile]|nr:MAG: hypothetical protein M1839_001819 [Geoglossum umbratile]
MAGDEYAAAGGSLKLKGVKDSKVDKKRKKKKVKAQPENETASDNIATAEATTEGEKRSVKSREGSLGAIANGEASTPLIIGKTEAERRHEEMRRKRLDERLKREGTKTHKERVEELNKYLSNLSEHHDILCLEGLVLDPAKKIDAYREGGDLACVFLDVDSVAFLHYMNRQKTHGYLPDVFLFGSGGACVSLMPQPP